MHLKNKLFQLYLRLKNHNFRKIPSAVKLSKDLVIGNNVKIENSIIGNNVVLKNNVKIGELSVIRNVEIGENTQVERGVIITGFGSGYIKVGKECYIGAYNILDFSDDITIGDYVHIAGPSTALWTHSSAKMCLKGDALNNKTPENRPTDPIIIESNVYIGGNCTIYPGITIGHHSIVAPNSAVNKDVAPYSMAGGVPAEVIKKLNQEKKD